MRFKLHLPSDPSNKEFQLTPSEGVVLPHGRVRLLLEFVSYKVMVYKVSVVVDVDSVGEALLALPIAADVVVPEIEPDETIVDFEEAFIGHAYSRKLLVRNLEELPARFEVVAQDAASKAIGAYEVTPSRAEIPPRGEVELDLSFTTARLGKMSLPLSVRPAPRPAARPRPPPPPFTAHPSPSPLRLQVRIVGAPLGVPDAFAIDLLATSIGPRLKLFSTTEAAEAKATESARAAEEGIMLDEDVEGCASGRASDRTPPTPHPTPLPLTPRSPLLYSTAGTRARS